MKIRNSFVSNSSSSSFVVFGYLLEKNNDILGKLNKLFKYDTDINPLEWEEIGKRIMDLNWYYDDNSFGQTNVPKEKALLGVKLYSFDEDMKVFEFNEEIFDVNVLEDHLGKPKIICGIEAS